ncbi:antibiotic biosynthesis monooxygenase [Rhizobium sp. SSA_523]|uniref:antibiotic biosynthesis monooxygenase family protein n=1 Tax=Rhizobium sp. SSA_523 TaxID=2952477 RepID=UPI00209146A5|nr:antibiotic biosynthesis monooxygenase [Rhizobium sp. SSA_523]MCO5732032.1 antibiotic biosynthesis monooxygenase [Rhizobium sp. SSA_523]WKC22630.1 antibiotic biosynthesis monooxygenase [Rhizobium sp. SSA_523]
MYIAMNRFRVVPGYEQAFEEIWKSRERHLSSMPGYVEFHMLKGGKQDDHTLYVSHTVWESQEHFTAWTKSEQFRAAHARAGENRGKVEYLSGPHFEGFEVIIHEDRNGRAAVAA